MRPQSQPGGLFRATRFEAFEERLALSAQPAGDFFLDDGVDQRIQQQYGDIAPALADVHDLTGVNQAQHVYGLDGAGQTIAVIDSGIAYDHYALGAGFGSSYRVVGGWDFAENDANPYDDGPGGFHGTHVAGIIGSSDDSFLGVAPEADLVALRVFDDNGAGYFTWVEQALQWVHENQRTFENPITTVNLSLGTTWNEDRVPEWATLEDEFAKLKDDGIFIAVSAGNSFQDYGEPGLSFPAASPHVVPVASIDSDGMLSSFSQRNSRVLAAPGRSITSTVPDHVFGSDGVPNDFGSASGTSMASPYVAGASALLRQAMEKAGYQSITQDVLYDHFVATADVIFDEATNASYHRIDVGAALDALIPVDDYGSTEDAAFSLGTVSESTTLTGLIGAPDDVDYFTFTAGATGTASIIVDGRYAQAILVGSNTQLPARSFSFETEKGHLYSLLLRGTDSPQDYELTINVEAEKGAVVEAGSMLDATEWAGSEQVRDSGSHGAFFGDDLIPVDVTRSYDLSGWSRSGDENGDGYAAGNRQYFGFASYDADGHLILPHHVRRFDGAADTRLARTLRPGDTQIVLEDVSGWNDGGAAHQRSLAWYGYSDSSGHVYEDYTYTRNVKYMDAWDVGGIDYETNTITLRTAWDGPELAAGVAVRNAQSGATYNYAMLSGASVSNAWTRYESTVSGVDAADASSFRPGTAYIRSLVLTNYHGQDGNVIRWRDVEVRPAEAFVEGDRVDLRVAPIEAEGAHYAWTQLSGPAVNILNADTAMASFTAPVQFEDYDLSFRVTIASDEFSASDVLTVDVVKANDPLSIDASLDATTWNGSETLDHSGSHGAFFGDDLIPVDVTRSYDLSGWSRSGDENGDGYAAGNRQYFGFASYDADGHLILPHHVRRFDGAADTRLARTLRPGDTQIVLEDVSGWNDGGAAHQRSLAWYGYSDSSGHVYEDYTYTRNVKYMDAWDVGGIDYETNTITLRTAWDGPELAAGVAVRNAQSGATYNYAMLSGASVSNAWTRYESTVSGVDAADASSFRPGTAYIRSLVLTNYHGQDGNVIRWRDVEVRPAEAFVEGDRVDLRVAPIEAEGAHYAWTQLSGPAVNILNADTAMASFTAPLQIRGDLSFQVTVSTGEFSASDIVVVHVAENAGRLSTEVDSEVALPGPKEARVHGNFAYTHRQFLTTNSKRIGARQSATDATLEESSHGASALRSRRESAFDAGTRESMLPSVSAEVPTSVRHDDTDRRSLDLEADPELRALDQLYAQLELEDERLAHSRVPR